MKESGMTGGMATGVTSITNRRVKISGSVLKKTMVAVSLAVQLVPCALAKPNEEQALKADMVTAHKFQDFSQTAVLSSEEHSNGHRWVKAKILIKANPHVVWETVHEERKHDPDLNYSKVISQEKNQVVLEQKFCLIPVVGSAVCVMRNTEVPLERIDYSMISSDRFKAMEGSWVISPGHDPNTTFLELASYCDLGLPVPRSLMENVTGKKLQKRLSNVKNMAEALQLQVARSQQKIN